MRRLRFTALRRRVDLTAFVAITIGSRFFEGKSRASKIGITSVEALTWNAFLLLGIIGVLLFPYDSDRQDLQRAFWSLALFRRVFKDEIVHFRSKRRNFAESEKVSRKRRSNRGFGCR